jgi:hypothetical protein
MLGRTARRTILILGAAASMATAGSTAAMASTIPSHAQPQAAPYSAVGCSGNACIFLGTPYQDNGKWYVDVHGCVWKSTVNGTYIQITSPNTSYKSATGRWTATKHYCTDGDDYYALKVGPNPPTGTWCSSTHTGGNETGQACENLGSYAGPNETAGRNGNLRS